jgi:hypothetical protein
MFREKLWSNGTVRQWDSRAERQEAHWVTGTVRQRANQAVKQWGSRAVEQLSSGKDGQWDRLTIEHGGSGTMRKFGQCGRLTAGKWGHGTVGLWCSRQWGSTIVRQWESDQQDSETVKLWDSSDGRVRQLESDQWDSNIARQRDRRWNRGTVRQCYNETLGLWSWNTQVQWAS